MLLVGSDEVMNGGGKLVVVGVKFDAQSKELLTWALVKMTQPGDCVVALHVLETDAAANYSSFLSIVETFDATLGVFEGLCSLKQVDLKLKVCRGASLKKAITKEVSSSECDAAALILGISRTQHPIYSSASVAKYCAKKLPKHIAVFAVNNGKIVFKRKASAMKMGPPRDEERHLHFPHLVYRSPDTKSNGAIALKEESGESFQKSGLDIANSDCNPTPENNLDSAMGESFGKRPVDNSLALVTYSSPQKKSTWFIIRRLLHRQEKPRTSSPKKITVARWVFKFKERKRPAVMTNPNEKQSYSKSDDDCSPSSQGETSPNFPHGHEAVWPCLSPCSDSSNLPKELEGLHDKVSSACRLFSYQELVSATSNFAPENLVGKGGSSYVYKGCLPDGEELAVKLLKPSADLVKEFVLEIDVITSLHHKNIISLFGFCFDNKCLLLVYDFYSRGSLEENLHGGKSDSFGWSERFKVAIGVADALDYLHNGQEEAVIHRDVKSSNILLSDDFSPRLCDYGLSNWASNISSQKICTDVAGTFGYLAPEYFMHGRVSDKVDVYAFGVVLLELLSGRKPITSGYKGQESLVMWAKPILESGKFSELLDPNLDSNYDVNQLERMVLAAKLCIRRAPRMRPQIALVLKLLQGDEEVTAWAMQETDVLDEAEASGGTKFLKNMRSHLNLVLLDIEDDLSVSSPEQSFSIEGYLKGRWSRASSFD